MRPQKRYVPTFDQVSVNPDQNRAMMPAAPPIEIEAIGPNTVRVSIGGVSRVLDGISLCNVVNECLGDFRSYRSA
jgi:hypothetical protein